MERLILNDLRRWKESARRKPLILRGARQVGKTWALKELGRLNYHNTAYINFDENPEYNQFFESTKDVGRILQNLSMASGQTITPHDTLILFDEIQSCPQALGTLKYFKENRPEYHIACAGSLLGIALAGVSFPVGMVDFMDMGPMIFKEFLLANGDKNLAEYLDGIQEITALPDAFFNPLYERLKMYYVTGGMPESVKVWTEDRDTAGVQGVLSNILGAYERDFSKHPDFREFPRISLIWKSIPSQLSRENKKFLFKTVKEGARSREYEDALQWLCEAGLARKIYRCSRPGIPLSAYDDLSTFKLYMLDVGLLRRLSLLAPTAFAEGNRLFTEFKGALSENYVLQALACQFEATPRYWAVDNPRYEVDYIIQRENDILPVEVKSEDNIKSASLKAYKEKFGDQTKLRVRLSLGNLGLHGDILNIPLFMADYADKLMGIALAK
jgi:uncharacterized protein